MNVRDLLPPDDLPEVGGAVPAWVVRVAVVVVGVALTVMMYSKTGWLGLGLLISLIAALAPELRFGWLLMIFLAAAEVGYHGGLRWQLLVLLAGIHLLHVLAQFTVELPVRSWVSPAVFVMPLLRFVAIQIPCQVLAVVGVLALGENSHGHRPVNVVELGVIGMIALAGLAAVMIRSIKDQPSANR